MKKVLIIKLGYFETLMAFQNLGVSLGDVLRTTFILNYFKDYDVSWLVDYKAVPLLEGNNYINEILIYKPETIDKIKKEKFDIIINFEKKNEICVLIDSLTSKKYFGFTKKDIVFTNIENIAGYKKFIKISQNIKEKRKNKCCWQDLLAKSIDKKWNFETYVLGYKPKSEIIYDIGFNWTTSSNWDNKSWAIKNWRNLEELLKDKYCISWQKGMNDLYSYMEWINSCKLIVTADTLGLHLALAMNKRVVALFGPTVSEEIYLYGLGSSIKPEINLDCMPCISFECSKKKFCMNYIFPEKVKEKIDYEFKKIKSS
jgi:heptosyltransferase II